MATFYTNMSIVDAEASLRGFFVQHRIDSTGLDHTYECVCYDPDHNEVEFEIKLSRADEYAYQIEFRWFGERFLYLFDILSFAESYFVKDWVSKQKPTNPFLRSTSMATRPMSQDEYDATVYHALQMARSSELHEEGVRKLACLCDKPEYQGVLIGDTMLVTDVVTWIQSEHHKIHLYALMVAFQLLDQHREAYDALVNEGGVEAIQQLRSTSTHPQVLRECTKILLLFQRLGDTK